MEKTKKKVRLLKSTADTIILVEVAWASIPIDLTWRYRLIMSKADIEAVKELGLTGVKNYCRRAGQVEIELDGLYDWISALATFVRHSQKVYNSKEIGKNMSVRQDIDLK